ncbi:transposase [Salipiger thiooxidans]|uniref:transposase n=1 Tax=Salipiger thiooxidans TaxID=282683 RepID=UPI001CD813A6|nr:transposase [Salipiger thiooxidans]MCA0849196.1 transposase [Salipiger thiooxidans]
MFAKSSFLTALGVEVFASGQRRWPDQVKAQAVAETLEPGATVSGIAARYEIMPSQLTAWRRLAKEGKLVLPAVEVNEAVFAPLVVCDEITAASEAEPPSAGTPIRIARGTVIIELAKDAPVARVAEIVHALEGINMDAPPRRGRSQRPGRRACHAPVRSQQPPE